MYAFSDPEDDDDDDEEFTDGFYFGSNEPAKKELVFSNETARIANEMSKSITQLKTSPFDFETLQFEYDYRVNKTWLKRFVQELEAIHVKTKKKSLQAALKNEKPVLEKLSKLNLNNPPQLSPAELKQIKQMEEEMMKKIESRLDEEFTASKHPYWLNLVLIENCKDYNLNKYNSLAYVVAKTFNKWLNASSVSDSEYLTTEIKKAAFMISNKYHLLLIDYLTKSYKLNEDNQFLLPYLKYRISPDCDMRWKVDNKDKALLINACMMHEHFNFEEILMPLLLQDKLTVLEKYLSKCESQQKLFLQFLDQIYVNDSNLASYYHRCNNLKEVKSDKLTNKFLAKFLTRLIKTYDIDASICPNITNQRFYKNLKYLIYRRYIEKSINYEPWNDLIAECLSQADYLNEEFIEMLAEHDDYKEINKWMKILNIKIEFLSSYTKSSLETYRDENQTESQDQIDFYIDNNYYKLKLSDNKIKFIDTKEFLFECLDEIINSKRSKSGHVFVGIDSEWKPSMLSGVNDEDSKRASLIQLSTYENVYLIDISTLFTIMSSNDKEIFSKKFVLNKNIIKIGYGFSEDIKKISHSFNVSDHDQFRQSVLDLEYMIAQLIILNVPLFEFENETDEVKYVKERGLSELVRLCFGKPLNKSEQISNWEKRPLRQTQLTYAALDAFVLLELYIYLKNRLKILNINFDIHKCIGKRYKMSANQQNKSNKKVAEVLEQQQLNEIKKFEDENFKLIEKPIGVLELRIVCDNMLGGLGKELRRCGIDTVILENDRKHTDVAKIARHENRYAISSGLPYFIIRSQLPEGRCIHVKTESAKSQCTQVLRILNVSVKVTDLFSRCRACNTGSYTIIFKKQAKALWFKCKNDFPDLFAGYEKSKSKSNSKSVQIDLKVDDYDLTKDEDLIDKIDLCTFHLVKYPNVRVLFESIFDTTLEVVDIYYICDGCGHIYWEGPHWQNITTRFSHVLTEKEINNHVKKSDK